MASEMRPGSTGSVSTPTPGRGAPRPRQRGVLDDSVAIGISNTGRTTETIEMLAPAKSSGAYTVAITSDAASPLARVADAHLITGAPEEYLQPDDLSAKHAQLFVLDLLYLIVAQRDFSRTTALAASQRPSRPTAGHPARRPRPVRTLAGRNRHSMSAPPAASPPRSRRASTPRPGGQRRRSRRGHRPHRASFQRGGVLQAFGTGHSQAFAMEIAGRAGGLIPTNRSPCATSCCTAP